MLISFFPPKEETKKKGKCLIKKQLLYLVNGQHFFLLLLLIETIKLCVLHQCFLIFSRSRTTSTSSARQCDKLRHGPAIQIRTHMNRWLDRSNPIIPLLLCLCCKQKLWSLVYPQTSYITIFMIICRDGHFRSLHRINPNRLCIWFLFRISMISHHLSTIDSNIEIPKLTWSVWVPFVSLFCVFYLHDLSLDRTSGWLHSHLTWRKAVLSISQLYPGNTSFPSSSLGAICRLAIDFGNLKIQGWDGSS